MLNDLRTFGEIHAALALRDYVRACRLISKIRQELDVLLRASCFLESLLSTFGAMFELHLIHPDERAMTLQLLPVDRNGSWSMTFQMGQGLTFEIEDRK